MRSENNEEKRMAEGRIGQIIEIWEDAYKPEESAKDAKKTFPLRYGIMQEYARLRKTEKFTEKERNVIARGANIMWQEASATATIVIALVSVIIAGLSMFIAIMTMSLNSADNENLGIFVGIAAMVLIILGVIAWLQCRRVSAVSKRADRYRNMELALLLLETDDKTEGAEE